jgi:hypothetical protein
MTRSKQKEHLRFLLLAGATSTQPQPQLKSISQIAKSFCSPLLLFPLLFHKIIRNGDVALHIQNVFTKHDLEQWHSYSCEMAAGKQDARICMRKLLTLV